MVGRVFYTLLILLLFLWPAVIEGFASGTVSQQPVDMSADILPSYRSVSKDSAGYKTLIESARSVSKKDPVQALEIGMEALLLAEELDSSRYISEANIIIGNRYIEFGEYDKALEHYLRSYEIQRKIGTPTSRAILTNNIAAALNQKGDYRTAVSYLEQALAELQQADAPQTHAGILMNLGGSYHYQGNFQKAKEYFEKAMRRFSDLGYQMGYHQALGNIGEAEMELGRLGAALEKTTTSLAYFRERGFPLGITIALGALGEVYQKMDRLDQALNAINEALDTASEINALDQLKNLYDLKASVLEELNRPEEALAAYKLHKAFSDSVSNADREKRIDYLQARLGLLTRERQIKQLVSQASFQSSLNSIYLAGIIVFILITFALAIVYYQKKQVAQRLAKQREKVREQNHRLRTLNEERSEFISIAAHDLKNALNAILSSSEFLINKEITEEERKSYLEIIEESARRMNTTIANFLKVQSAEQERDEKAVDFAEIVRESVATYSVAAQRKSIEIREQIPDQLPSVSIGETAARNILENLLSNAIKYSPKNTTITVRLAIGESTVRLSVKDQGPGIPQEEQQDLFKKFRTLSTRDKDSTGLGLYIVKKQVEAAGGNIWYESGDGQGSTFYVELPAENSNRE